MLEVYYFFRWAKSGELVGALVFIQTSYCSFRFLTALNYIGSLLYLSTEKSLGHTCS